ncbi:hypothetical protein QAD02_000240 [Eretmocerus hayati]|uniref:Uncharacterized protein n=1 Tax=Eretmocerus hayati TaxID=131215 RepID=A0ACC2NEF5_9HYME|nr:hypothetical protein QAD02_000240 [Eretmocerus hayati]
MAEGMEGIVKTIAIAISDAQQQQPKPPQFSFREFHSTENTAVTDYFRRFDWALQLSKISEDQYANYARVHMGSELNDALKFLVSPEEPGTCSYKDLCKLLIEHFDSKKNKYAESVKFRSVVQNKEESVAKFALRLKQVAAHCEYGSFLDQMLIEQLLHGDHVDGKKQKPMFQKVETEKYLAAYLVAMGAVDYTDAANVHSKTSNVTIAGKLDTSRKYVRRKTLQQIKRRYLMSQQQKFL